MLDIKFVRENPEIVKQNIRNKFQDKKLPLVDEVIELDKRNRESLRLRQVHHPADDRGSGGHHLRRAVDRRQADE